MGGRQRLFKTQVSTLHGLIATSTKARCRDQGKRLSRLCLQFVMVVHLSLRLQSTQSQSRSGLKQRMHQGKPWAQAVVSRAADNRSALEIIRRLEQVQPVAPLAVPAV